MNTILAQKHCERAVERLEQVLRTVPVYQERRHRQYLMEVVEDIVAAALAEMRAEMTQMLEREQEQEQEIPSFLEPERV